MKQVFVTFTKEQAKVLLEHFTADYDYEENGTFGTGEKYHSKKDYKTAKEVINVLNTAILKSK